jgi:hypothetical protein
MDRATIGSDVGGKSLSAIKRLKIAIMSSGISITPKARDAIGKGSALTIRDYATTGGLTLRLPGDVFVNAPVDDWYCDRPAATLDSVGSGLFILEKNNGPAGWAGEAVEVLPVPLPSYVGKPSTDGVMTHADRIRISPIDGCSYACAFCDSHLSNYRLRPIDELRLGLDIALQDRALPPRHVLISGGTPRTSDRKWLDSAYQSLIASSPLPTDVMLTASVNSELIERLAECGVHGLSINLEAFDQSIAASVCPQKQELGRDAYASAWALARDLLGPGRVRSLLLVGLEPLESTLAGVEFIAAHGCDPVLSPFRPAPGTCMEASRPPDRSFLSEVYEGAQEIVARFDGVALGPRCIPCQHNTLTFPDDGDVYSFT